MTCAPGLGCLLLAVALGGCLDDGDTLDGDLITEDGALRDASHALGSNEAGDHFGTTTAVGDFDGDGFDDLAIGAPDEAPGSDPASGAVFLLHGSELGLQPWKVLTQETRAVSASGSVGAGLGVNAKGDRYGAALAVGDFNHDGVADLAVGAPGKAASILAPRAGAVFLYAGYPKVAGDARLGLNAWQEVDAQDLGTAPLVDDGFGAALAHVYTVTPTFFDGLAIGAPGSGAPGQPRGGAVFVALVSPTVTLRHLVTAADLGQVAVAGDHLGAALAAYNLDDFGSTDLVVGVPDRTVGGKAKAGAVAMFNFDGEVPSQLFVDPSGAAGDRFGAAVVAGDLGIGIYYDFIASAPGHAGGRALVFHTAGLGQAPSLWATLAQLAPEDDVAGDGYGKALALADLDADGLTDLVVGAPGERVGNNAAASGQVTVVWNNGGGSLVAATGVTQSPIDDNGDGDQFAATVAVGSFDGVHTAVIAGAPGEDLGAIVETGAVFELTYGDRAVTSRRQLLQNTPATP